MPQKEPLSAGAHGQVNEEIRERPERDAGKKSRKGADGRNKFMDMSGEFPDVMARLQRAKGAIGEMVPHPNGATWVAPIVQHFHIHASGLNDSSFTMPDFVKADYRVNVTWTDTTKNHCRPTGYEAEKRADVAPGDREALVLEEGLSQNSTSYQRIFRIMDDSFKEMNEQVAGQYYGCDGPVLSKDGHRRFYKDG